jgi:hypothetical protein
MRIARYAGCWRESMNSKYYNRKVKRDGMVFDSKREANRWTELKLLEKAGKISNLQRQVKFVLIPTQYSDWEYTKSGKKKVIEREASYIADFVYRDNELGVDVVEDTKGMRTEAYILKRKLMLRVHGIQIMEV